MTDQRLEQLRNLATMGESVVLRELITEIDRLRNERGNGKRHEYAAMSAASVIAIATATHSNSDGYLSDDADTRRYFDLLKRGFRWIRTDLDVAIFERETSKS